MTASVQAYLDAALTILRQHALTKAAVDWESVGRDALAQGATMTTSAATYSYLRQVIRQLGDHHSYLLTPAAAQRELDGQAHQVGLLVAHPTGVVMQVLPDSPAAAAGMGAGDIIAAVNGIAVAEWDTDALSAALQAEQVRLTSATPDRHEITLAATSFAFTALPRGQLIGPAVGYLDVPAMLGPAALAQEYAEQLQAAIRAGEQQGARGWIVDLRRNTGGNMWPMLAGLGPLLGDGDLGAFAYPDGATESWSYQAGKVALDGWTMAQVASPHARQTTPPLAILISRATRSSGELTALALRGVPQARSFGEATAGVPTATAPFALSDGAVIVLTVAYGADRHDHTYDAALIPDQPIANDWRHIGTVADPVLQAAITWIKDAAGLTP